MSKLAFNSIAGLFFILSHAVAFSQGFDLVEDANLCGCEQNNCLYLEYAGLSQVSDSLLPKGPVSAAFFGENELKEIPRNLLAKYPYLTCLEINGNKIAKLQGNDLKLNRLQSLNLSANQLSTFGKGIDAPKLQALYLGGNPLLSVRLKARNLPSLREIKLNNCKLRSVHMDFAYFWQLRILDLSGNLLSEVPEGIREMPVLEELSLNGNNFGRRFSIDALPPSLNYLDLGECGIEELEGDWSRLKKLEHLDLGNNPLNLLPRGIFEETHLRYIKVNGAHLEDPDKVLKEICQFQQLEVLDFEEASIDDLPEEITALSELFALNLQNCKIRRLPENLKALPRLSVIYLGGNPLEPGELEKLQAWMPQLQIRD